jgi:phosphoribosylanthranilate isomerase
MSTPPRLQPLAVKVCGITNAEDAAVAAASGADLLGFNFYPPSPRFVSPPTAAAIARGLPRRILRVGVFVNPEVNDVERIINTVGLDLIQLHGDEAPELCARFRVPAIKALRVNGLGDLAAAAARYPHGWLLADTADPVLYGGTGRALPLASLAPELAARVFVAGGLVPESVIDVVRRVRPLGVDVCSGVESGPGRKDRPRLQRFVSHAKAA